MTEETATFEVEVEGVPLAIDQLESLLHDVASEGQRGGVTVSVRRIDEQDDGELEGFSNAHDHESE